MMSHITYLKEGKWQIEMGGALEFSTLYNSDIIQYNIYQTQGFLQSIINTINIFHSDIN